MERGSKNRAWTDCPGHVGNGTPFLFFYRLWCSKRKKYMHTIVNIQALLSVFGDEKSLLSLTLSPSDGSSSYRKELETLRCGLFSFCLSSFLCVLYSPLCFFSHGMPNHDTTNSATCFADLLREFIAAAPFPETLDFSKKVKLRLKLSWLNSITSYLET